MGKVKGIVAIMFVLAARSGEARDSMIENVRFQVQGSRIEVYYDLLGDGTYNTSLRVHGLGKTPLTIPEGNLEGDIGAGVKPGDGKRVLWEPMWAEIPEQGTVLVFEVVAHSERKWPFRAWHLLGGVAIAAGIAQAIHVDEPTNGTIVLDIPDPE